MYTQVSLLGNRLAAVRLEFFAFRFDSKLHLLSDAREQTDPAMVRCGGVSVQKGSR
jgi:hypothetical protein